MGISPHVPPLLHCRTALQCCAGYARRRRMTTSAPAPPSNSSRAMPAGSRTVGLLLLLSPAGTFAVGATVVGTDGSGAVLGGTVAVGVVGSGTVVGAVGAGAVGSGSGGSTVAAVITIAVRATTASTVVEATRPALSAARQASDTPSSAALTASEQASQVLAPSVEYSTVAMPEPESLASTVTVRASAFTVPVSTRILVTTLKSAVACASSKFPRIAGAVLEGVDALRKGDRLGVAWPRAGADLVFGPGNFNVVGGGQGDCRGRGVPTRCGRCCRGGGCRGDRSHLVCRCGI